MKLLAKLLLTSAIAASATGVYAAGDAEAGKNKASTCVACHGADGNSTVPNFPKLAGQSAGYIVKQLQDMKSGARPVPEMAAFLPALNDQDIEDLGAYYAEQPIQPGSADPKLVELGQSVYRAGNAESGVTACAACHGANGKGMPEAGFPALAGQHAAYIEKQLKAFRAAGREDHNGARRENDGETKMMRATAARLSDDEISALSSYINGLY
ncbi:cytochrome c4 [Ketobacter sp. MCCC 1A13808]|uniref:c-type cytochrome n=1 Tax=Ketobacter sp. MCCC 1A13808 TaxID=2602738 RepID=UPI000F298C24|nr:c-type cytochrome [Ketobacter sp. MCCC 1A13808]MVF12001.1 cytochrome c4 [Ketobacter sp. MCCC 1A13808]RLP52731.1 MAG: cytochrome c4 [Ketobacter sp.]